MRFDLPHDTVFPVDRVAVRLDDEPHPFELANANAIEEHWRGASATNPALFDGWVALLSELVLRGGQLVGRCHIVRYATFLYWRTLRPVDQAGHAYAHAMLVSADNALVAIRMAKTTANPGMVYFAAGTFEAIDFRDGYADIAANMHREVMEETGIDLSGARREPQLYAVSKATGTVVFQRYFLEASADELADAIAGHVARQAASEIDEAVIIRSSQDLPDRLAMQMPDLIRWHFEEVSGNRV